MNRDRAAPGPVADAVQPIMSRDRAVAAPCGDGVQTVVGTDGTDILDGGTAGEKRLISNVMAGSREVQAVENPTEPPPTNPVLVAPQQVQKFKLSRENGLSAEMVTTWIQITFEII